MNPIEDGRHYVASGVLTGGAITLPAFHLKNPAASGRLVILRRYTISAETITVATDASIGFVSGRRDTDISGAPGYATIARPTNDYWGASASVAQLGKVTGSSAVDLPSPFMARGGCLKNTSVTVDLTEVTDDGVSRAGGVVLDEGTGFVVKTFQLCSDGTTVGVSVTFEWTEVVVP